MYKVKLAYSDRIGISDFIQMTQDKHNRSA